MTALPSSPKRTALENGSGGITLLTEAQLTRLLQRLAVTNREPRAQSAFATLGASGSFSPPGTFTQIILPASKYRWGVAVMVQSGGPCVIRFGTNDPGSQAGMGVSQTSSTLLTYNEIGAVILGQIQVGSTVGAVFGFQEFVVPFPLDGSRLFTL